MTPSSILRSIAPLVDALEREGVEIEQLTIDETGSRVRYTVNLNLPGNETEDRWDVVATPAGDADSGDVPVSEDGPAVDPTDVAATEAEPGTHEKEPRAPPEHPSTARTDEHSPAAASSPTADDDSPSEDHDDDATVTTNTDDRASGDRSLVECSVDGCEQTFESTQGMRVHAAKAHEAAEDADTLPYRDPEQLETVYETNATFEEMRDALGVDVTAQTVRRNMMKFDIHEPGATDDAEPRASVPDGGTETRAASSEERSEPSIGEQSSPPAGAGEADADTDPGDHADAAGGPDELAAIDASDEPATDEDPAPGSAFDPDTTLEPSLLPGDVAVPPNTTIGDLVDALRVADSPADVRRDLELGRGETQLLCSFLGVDGFDVQPSRAELVDRIGATLDPA